MRRWAWRAAIGLALVGVLSFVLFGRVVLDHETPTERARSDVHAIAQAAEFFRKVHGRFPTTEEGTRVLLRDRILQSNNEHGTHLDPWGRPWVYRSPGRIHPDSFDVLSYGGDGKPGGKGEDADIVNE